MTNEVPADIECRKSRKKIDGRTVYDKLLAKKIDLNNDEFRLIATDFSSNKGTPFIALKTKDPIIMQALGTENNNRIGKLGFAYAAYGRIVGWDNAEMQVDKITLRKAPYPIIKENPTMRKIGLDEASAQDMANHLNVDYQEMRTNEKKDFNFLFS